MKNTEKLVRKLEERRQLGRGRSRREDNTELY
jgi:hypothetical protein